MDYFYGKWIISQKVLTKNLFRPTHHSICYFLSEYLWTVYTIVTCTCLLFWNHYIVLSPLLTRVSSTSFILHFTTEYTNGYRVSPQIRFLILKIQNIRNIYQENVNHITQKSFFGEIQTYIKFPRFLTKLFRRKISIGEPESWGLTSQES